MNNIIFFSILLTLVSGLVFMPFIGIQLDNGNSGIDNGNSGIGYGSNAIQNGHDIGKGHIKGKGKGHDKHNCDGTCPLCGGAICVPPCPNA
ncbi:hypothetical protein ACFLT9_11685 [Acidobacteriota bacterium]